MPKISNYPINSCLLHKIVLLVQLIQIGMSLSINNVCTFRTQGKLFSLTYLQLAEPYRLVHGKQAIYFNFCFAFVPPQCPPQSPAAFSHVVTQVDDQNKGEGEGKKIFKCERYSSNSTISLFYTRYDTTLNQNQKQEQKQKKTLKLFMITQQPQISAQIRTTIFKIDCSHREHYWVEDYQISNGKLQIQGNSRYGCPVFELSTIWKIFSNHKLFFGILLFLIGFFLLFFGRSAIDITVFITVFFVSMAAIGSILTLFVSPNSSNLVIYGSFLLLLFVCCLLGHMATKLIKISVFFIGAFFGMILGVLVSSAFSKIFNVYASWPLIVFILGFSIPLGLLTFKYHDQVIIASTSFTGAYMVVRPISWVVGGFPNQFLLYQAVQSGQIKELPSTFFIYVVIIFLVACIGSMYQKLKLQRQNPQQQIQINIIQNNIQKPIDSIKIVVDKLIQKFRSPNHDVNSSYRPLQEKNNLPNNMRNNQKQNF